MQYSTYFMLSTKFNSGDNNHGRKVEETAAFLFKNGMRPEVINRIIHTRPKLLDDSLANTMELYSNMSKNGFKPEQISQIISETPELLMMNPTCIKAFTKSCKDNSIEQDQIKAILIYSPPHMVHLMRYIGMDNESIEKAVKGTNILFYYSDSMWTAIDMLKELRVDMANIREFVKNNYKKLSFKADNAKNVFYTLRVMELSNLEISSMIIKQPFILYYNSESIRGVFDALLNLGADFDSITQLFMVHPEIMDCKIENLCIIRNLMKGLGESTGIIEVLEKDPSILVNTNENRINTTVGTLLKNGFNLKDVLSILKEMPSILSSCDKDGVENILSIVRTFTKNERAMVKVFLDNPQLLVSDHIRVMSNLKLLSEFNFDPFYFTDVLSKSDFTSADIENNKKIITLFNSLDMSNEHMLKLMEYSNIFFMPFDDLEQAIGSLIMNGHSKNDILKSIIEKPEAFFKLSYRSLRRISDDDINGPE